MTIKLTDTTIAIVIQSIQLMQLHRRELSSAMGRYIAARQSIDASEGREVALVLMEMLFEHVRNLAGLTRAPQVEATIRRHRVQGITPGHYMCFGDGLGAIMKDVLGTRASPSLLSAWGDAYWSIARSVSRQERLLAA